MFFRIILVLGVSSISAWGISPKETLIQFQELCAAGRAGKATKLVAEFPNLHPLVDKLAQESIERIVSGLKTGKFSYTTITEKIDHDCAVVMIKEERPGRDSEDYDPIYLVKQDNQWKILPKPSNWKVASEVMNNRQVFEGLASWFDEQKASIMGKDE